MKRMTLFVMALAMVLGLAQCKKDQPVTPDAQGVTITLNVGDNNSGEKVNVTPYPTGDNDQVTFTDGDQILVASDGKYIGMLTRTGGIFSGEVFNPVEDQPLYFYFLGNKAEATALEAGTTEECTVNISDQTGELPVISMGQSRDANGKSLNYQDGMTSFYSCLYNKASLMKFNVTTPSEAAICITGMNNTVTVNFGQPTEDNYGFTYGKDDAGLIMMAGQEGTGEKTYWAIVLPQAELAEGTEGSVYSFDEAYVGTRPAIHAIEVNKFYHEGEDVITMEVSTVVDPLATPLTLEALTDGNIRVNNPKNGMKYSKNGGTKTTMSGNTTINVVTGDKVQFYGNGTNISSYYHTAISFGTAQVKAYGNIMSLIDEENFATATTLTSEDVFKGLFSGDYNNDNTSLIDASGLLLPATMLTESCYSNMFANCTALTAAPELPATTLAYACYESMFNGCTNLTAAPSLPATNLAFACYASMFEGCTGLQAAPSLPAETLAESCYAYMFNGCTSLQTAPSLPAETLAESCYEGMFYGCTSLQTAPSLPAETLAVYCYSNMFDGCTGLTQAPPVLPATTMANYCYSNMFNGCTSLTTAPTLPAPALVKNCYDGMFRDCGQLNSITCLATSGIDSNYSTRNWMMNVASSGTFTKAAGASWPTGPSGIPTGWTVVSPPPTGAISGLFTINDNGDQVYFSKGNLQYQASTNTWRFATNQYDYVGSDNSNISSSYSGWIDLFGWGTSGYNHNNHSYQPWETNETQANYYAYNNQALNLWQENGQAEWGYNAISNGGNQENIGWHTLIPARWEYLFYTRTTSSGIRYAKAQVNGVNGMIMLPDDWNTSYYTLNSTNTANAKYNTNVISLENWNNVLEPHGAVFLPDAGVRVGTTIYTSVSCYWTSDQYYTYQNKDQCCNLWMHNTGFSFATMERYKGASVRLVIDAN